MMATRNLGVRDEKCRDVGQTIKPQPDRLTDD